MSESDELRQIAERLLIVAQQHDQLAPVDPAVRQNFPHTSRRRTNNDPTTFADPDTLASLATGLYDTRRLRERHFKYDLFADPAWDILLDLFVQKSCGRRVSITSACIASGVPPTTGLRWVALLVEEGLVLREGDDVDRRRAFLRLSATGETAVKRTLIDSLAYLRSATIGAFSFGGGRR